MDFYIKIAIILAPIVFLLWRAYKMSKHIDKLESTIYILVNLLESNKDKEYILDYFKKTNVYNELANKRK